MPVILYSGTLANEFRKQADIDKLYLGNALSTKLYKNHPVSFDPDSLEALDGFCISADDYFQVELKGDKTRLGLTVEEQGRLVLDSIAPLLNSRLLALSEVQLQRELAQAHAPDALGV